MKQGFITLFLLFISLQIIFCSNDQSSKFNNIFFKTKLDTTKWNWESPSKKANLFESKIISEATQTNCNSPFDSVNAYVKEELKDGANWEIKVLDIEDPGYMCFGIISADDFKQLQQQSDLSNVDNSVSACTNNQLYNKFGSFCSTKAPLETSQSIGKTFTLKFSGVSLQITNTDGFEAAFELSKDKKYYPWVELNLKGAILVAGTTEKAIIDVPKADAPTEPPKVEKDPNEIQEVKKPVERSDQRPYSAKVNKVRDTQSAKFEKTPSPLSAHFEKDTKEDVNVVVQQTDGKEEQQVKVEQVVEETEEDIVTITSEQKGEDQKDDEVIIDKKEVEKDTDGKSAKIKDIKKQAPAQAPSQPSEGKVPIEEKGKSAQINQPEEKGKSAQINQPEEKGKSAQINQPEEKGKSAQISQPEEKGKSAQISQPEEKGKSAQINQPDEKGKSAKIDESQPLPPVEEKGKSAQIDQPQEKGKSAAIDPVKPAQQEKPVEEQGKSAQIDQEKVKAISAKIRDDAKSAKIRDDAKSAKIINKEVKGKSAKIISQDKGKSVKLEPGDGKSAKIEPGKGKSAQLEAKTKGFVQLKQKYLTRNYNLKRNMRQHMTNQEFEL